MDTSRTSSTRNNLSITQKKSNMTLNSSISELTIKSPKRVKKKLSKLFQASLDPEHQDETNQCRHNIIQYLIDTYEYCFSVIDDGNQLYRIVGIHILKRLINSSQKMEQFCLQLTSKEVDTQILKNIPREFAEQYTPPKLVRIFKTLAECISKKPSRSFLRSISSLLNSHPIFDFALICVCRVYSYFFGYRQLKSTEDIQYEDLIADYNLEATSEIVNIMCQCFKTEIHIYSVCPEVNTMCHIPKLNLDQQQQHVPIVMLQISDRYYLLERTSECSNSIRKEEYISDYSSSVKRISHNRVATEGAAVENEINHSENVSETRFKKKLSVKHSVEKQFQLPIKYNLLRPKQEMSSEQPFLREDLKLSNISNVQSYYIDKIPSPTHTFRQGMAKYLSVFKMKDVLVEPVVIDSDIRISIEDTEEKCVTVRSNRRTAGKIHRQALSPPQRRNRDTRNMEYVRDKEYMVEEQQAQLPLVRLQSRVSEESGVESMPLYTARSMRRSNKKIVIHTKEFSIQLFKH